MIIDELRKSGRIAYEYVRGSHLHNLATETSDVDLGGVYICPEKELLGMSEHYCPEVKNPSNDECFYEFGRWIQLLSSSNPTVLESLFVPDDKIIGEVHPVIRKVIENRDKFLTKAAFKPLAGYAFEQLKKARGLNKKINVDPNIKRKGVLEFCFVPFENGSKPLLKFLAEKGMNQEKMRLAKIDNITGLYSMYYDSDGTRGYKGVVNSEQTSNEVLCSSIPKGEPIVGHMFFNDAAYRCHCKEYKEYQDWIKHRNPVRYENNLGHNYDAKNMCHVIRL